MDNVQKGKIGEKWACRALHEAGYEILARRWRVMGGELDIIAKDGDGYAFVEVKNWTSQAYGHPAERITMRQLKFIHRAAEQWLLRELGTIWVAWRVDVVLVQMRGRRPHSIEVYQFYEV